MTIGMVVVAFMAATVLGLIPVATMMSTPSRTRSRQVRAAVQLAVGEAVLDDDILANAVAKAAQAFFERTKEMEHFLPGRDREVPTR